MCKSSLPLAICATTQVKKKQSLSRFSFPPQSVLFIFLPAFTSLFVMENILSGAKCATSKSSLPPAKVPRWKAKKHNLSRIPQSTPVFRFCDVAFRLCLRCVGAVWALCWYHAACTRAGPRFVSPPFYHHFPSPFFTWWVV